MKDIILKVRKNINRFNNRFNSNKYNNFIHKKIKPPSCHEKTFTKANFYELLNESIVESNESEDDDIVSEDAIGNNDYDLLVNSTTANNINPGDIRKYCLILLREILPLHQLKECLQVRNKNQ